MHARGKSELGGQFIRVAHGRNGCFLGLTKPLPGELLSALRKVAANLRQDLLLLGLTHAFQTGRYLLEIGRHGVSRCHEICLHLEFSFTRTSKREMLSAKSSQVRVMAAARCRPAGVSQ